MIKKIVVIWMCCIFTLLSIIAVSTDESQGNFINGPSTSITILCPEPGNVYLWSRPVFPLSINRTIIVGPIVVEAGVTGFNGFEVDFYIDGEHKSHDISWPFEYSWVEPGLGTYLITAELTGYDLTDSIKVFKIL